MFKKEKLLNILKGKTWSFRDLVRKMYIDRKDNKDFSRFLMDLVRSGEIFMTPSREYYCPDIKETITGIIRVNARAFGFIDLEDERSIFVAPNNINNAMDGDEVEAKIFKDPSKEDGYQGIIVNITKRARETFVGRVMKFGQSLGLKPLDARINGKFRFVSEEGVNVDDEVKVKIIKYGDISTVEIVRVLGHKDDVSIDILSSIEDADIPYVFGVDTQREAKEMPETVSEKDIEGREDLRGQLIVTIDGDDTKDFDDAINVKKLENGNYLLGVHIADVTHYVKEGKPLDDEAKMRGTSVYLADRVIPMLPESLSNGICSLNPHVDRLTVSCETEIDKDGNTVKYRVFPSVINSTHRLTYQEVNKYYRDLHEWEDKDLHKMLDEALEVSKIIRKFKQKQGYIDFEIEESKIIIDDQGKTADIVPRERLESEMMIEDFMVRANETVAYHAEKNDLAFIYRVHDKPDIERVTNLQNVVKILGMEVKIPTQPIPAEFARAIEEIKKSRFDDFMKIMMLRTMSKAEYSPKNIGHFGLASTHYSHFTSPIRRYPDLMVHRMLREYFFEGRKNRSAHFEEILPKISEHSSMTEQRAMDLERKVADIKKAEFYEQFVGQSFEGTVVSMMKFGFFVEFPNKVGGLVHTSTMIDGTYSLINNGYSMTNQARTFTVGDKVKVTVVGASKNEGKIDLVLSDLYEDWKVKESSLMKNHNRVQTRKR